MYVEAYLSNEVFIILPLQVCLKCWGALKEEPDPTEAIVGCNPHGAPGQSISTVPLKV